MTNPQQPVPAQGEALDFETWFNDTKPIYHTSLKLAQQAWAAAFQSMEVFPSLEPIKREARRLALEEAARIPERISRMCSNPVEQARYASVAAQIRAFATAPATPAGSEGGK